MSTLVLVELKAKTESLDAMKTWLKQGLPEARAYQGCESITVHANLNDQNNLVLVEHWASRDQYEKYRAWRIEKGDHAHLVAMLAGDLSVRIFEALDL